MRLLLYIFLLECLSISFAHSQHQSLDVTRYTVEEGLSNNAINCVLQTRDGFLWVATMNGLNRFDGTRFKIFQHDFSDSLSLPENYVMSLCEDSKGNLWVGTWGGGLCLFDRRKEQFIRYIHDPHNPNSPSGDYIQAFHEDRNGILWFGATTGGLNRLDTRTMTFKHYLNVNITSIAEEKSGILWLGNWDAGTKSTGLIRFNSNTETFSYFKHDSLHPKSIASDTVWSIMNDGDSILWLGMYSGVDKFDLRTKSAAHFKKEILDTSVIRQVLIDSKRRIWIGTFNYRGVFLFEHENGNDFVWLRSKNENTATLSSDGIRWLYEDFYGNIWIGTGDGLNKIVRTKPFIQFKYLPTSYKHRVVLVKAICEDSKGYLWVGYGGGGLDKIDRKTNTRTHYTTIQNDRTSLSYFDVETIYEDPKGVLWIGTQEGGLNCFDRATNSFTHFLHNPNDPKTIRADWTQRIIETRDGIFLVGTEKGTDVYDREKRTFTRFENFVNDTTHHIGGVAFCDDQFGNLWFGEWLNGIHRYNIRTKAYKHFLPVINNPNSLSSTKVSSIFEDSHGTIWICTFGGGINKFNAVSETFTHYTILNGLPNDAVFQIEEDSKGLLWISTMNGLARFDPVNKTFRTFEVSDGLVNNEFTWRSSFKNHRGEIFFGGMGGFISFFPDSIADDTRPVKVAITSFKVFQQEMQLPQSLQTTEAITLDYNQNFFSIEYAALDFADPSHHKYMYILEGFDKQWNNVGNRKFASYTDVHPGTYRFIVKAANSDGLWNHEGHSLSIIVTPAFWMTWWFKLLIAFLLIGLGVSFYRYRFNNILRLQNVRLKIAQDLHDEIGSNLSSITITSGLIRQTNNLNETQKEYLKDISVTAQETADAMHDIVWFINPDHDNARATLVKMKDVAQSLLHNIHYTFDVDETAFAKMTDLETRRNLYFIYKESLNNIVRHARATSVHIGIKKVSEGVLFTIADNGIGFEQDNISNGNGLHNLSKRAEDMRAELNIHSYANEGTTISLLVKIP